MLEILQDPVRRRETDATKWIMYPADVLPMWVADMDIRSPQVVIDALHKRIEEGMFGYTFDAPNLRRVIAERMAERHHLPTETNEIVYFPTLVYALHAIARLFAGDGKPILLNTPIYPPFLRAVTFSKSKLVGVPMVSSVENGVLRYEIDFDELVASITPETKLFMFCNPHNPIGRAFNRQELTRLAEIVERHQLIVCADEIHCDLMLNGQEHISFASLAPEIADRTITLMSPSKTFNVPMLHFSFGVIKNPALRARILGENESISVSANGLGYVAAEAAYTQGQPWLDELLVYLKGNRDALVEFWTRHFPQLPLTCPEATYLAWIDCRALELESPYHFFLEKAKVALNDGLHFGEDGKGFVRLNYGCSREMLMEALERMRAAIMG